MIKQRRVWIPYMHAYSVQAWSKTRKRWVHMRFENKAGKKL